MAFYSVKVALFLRQGGPKTPCRLPYRSDFCNKQKRSCRINEWCAIINVKLARKLAKEKKVLFGVYEDFGDIGAFWFDYVVNKGYKYSDPIIAEGLKREQYYTHWWQGYTGHSVWQDQGHGKQKYESEMIRERILEEYGISLPRYGNAI